MASDEEESANDDDYADEFEDDEPIPAATPVAAAPAPAEQPQIDPAPGTNAAANAEHAAKLETMRAAEQTLPKELSQHMVEHFERFDTYSDGYVDATALANIAVSLEAGWGLSEAADELAGLLKGLLLPSGIRRVSLARFFKGAPAAAAGDGLRC